MLKCAKRLAYNTAKRGGITKWRAPKRRIVGSSSSSSSRIARTHKSNVAKAERTTTTRNDRIRQYRKMPEEDADAAAAAAAAEVAAMTGVNPARRGGGQARRDATADQALMGAATEGSFELLDETGERVKTRFLQFLME